MIVGLVDLVRCRDRRGGDARDRGVGARARGTTSPRSKGGQAATRAALPLGIVEAAAIAFIVISCGLSPFLYGFYDPSVWGPITLFLLAGLLGLVIARPAAPRRTASLALGGLVGLWLWSLLSTRWAESAGQAMTEANRWMLYAALFAVLVLLLRDDRLSRIVVAASAAAITAFGFYLAGYGCCSATAEACSSARG